MNFKRGKYKPYSCKNIYNYIMSELLKFDILR